MMQNFLTTLKTANLKEGIGSPCILEETLIVSAHRASEAVRPIFQTEACQQKDIFCFKSTADVNQFLPYELLSTNLEEVSFHQTIICGNEDTRLVPVETSVKLLSTCDFSLLPSIECSTVTSALKKHAAFTQLQRPTSQQNPHQTFGNTQNSLNDDLQKKQTSNWKRGSSPDFRSTHNKRILNNYALLKTIPGSCSANVKNKKAITSPSNKITTVKPFFEGGQQKYIECKVQGKPLLKNKKLLTFRGPVAFKKTISQRSTSYSKSRENKNNAEDKSNNIGRNASSRLVLKASNLDLDIDEKGTFGAILRPGSETRQAQTTHYYTEARKTEKRLGQNPSKFCNPSSAPTKKENIQKKNNTYNILDIEWGIQGLTRTSLSAYINGDSTIRSLSTKMTKYPVVHEYHGSAKKDSDRLIENRHFHIIPACGYIQELNNLV